ncbi:kallikrein B, plasma (Fletcher factor) 1 [Nesidiocoris tenuis]|uniref:Kallikrein B, plasma (Fletcher factor) 1 n=1 Tax=Nesidiocoris tenuis TaxID=355587 RepID=A0ABN7BHN4_9HEMI|nr:kallikrein B, plasma (Fletcher factor) 1 [Nesidiocoris tenuis]
MDDSADWLLLFGFVANLATISGKNDDKIIGGHLASPVPYMSSVHRNGHHFCGGCLLTLSSILTACHCVGSFSRNDNDLTVEYVKLASPSYYEIYAGHTDIKTSSDDLQIRRARKFVEHPKCAKFQGIMEWDFAIIVTKSPFELNKKVHPIKLYSMDKKSFDERIAKINDRSFCWVMGWGKTDVHPDSPPTSRYLKYAAMKIIPLDKCRELLSIKSILFSAYDFQDRAQMCALGVNGSESDCTGDSGGPFVCDGEAVGTVSYGFDCGKPDEPAVYTKLSDFVEWYGSIKDAVERSSVPRYRYSLALLTWTVVINLLKV